VETICDGLYLLFFLNFLQIASFNSAYRAVIFVDRFLAASLIKSGVLKSGSP
jgi:hypothetical protein